MTQNMESRAIISIIILATFGGLMQLIASDFSGIQPADYQLIDVPSSLHGAEFMRDNVTDAMNTSIAQVGRVSYLLVDGTWEEKEYIEVEWQAYNPTSIMLAWKGDANWWGGYDKYEGIKPYPLSWSAIEGALETQTNQSVHYMNSKTYAWKVTFTFNGTAYDNITHAYDNADLYLQVGKGSESIVESTTAWGVITSILTWSSPDIHPAVNFFIAVPLYAMIGVVLVYMFTRIAEALIPL